MFPVCNEPGFISLRNRDFGGWCFRRNGEPSWAEIGKQQTQLSSRIRTFSKESPPLTGESRHWLASPFNYNHSHFSPLFGEWVKFFFLITFVWKVLQYTSCYYFELYDFRRNYVRLQWTLSDWSNYHIYAWCLDVLSKINDFATNLDSDWHLLSRIKLKTTLITFNVVDGEWLAKQ